MPGSKPEWSNNKAVSPVSVRWFCEFHPFWGFRFFVLCFSMCLKTTSQLWNDFSPLKNVMPEHTCWAQQCGEYKNEKVQFNTVSIKLYSLQVIYRISREEKIQLATITLHMLVGNGILLVKLRHSIVKRFVTIVVEFCVKPGIFINSIYFFDFSRFMDYIIWSGVLYKSDLQQDILYFLIAVSDPNNFSKIMYCCIESQNCKNGKLFICTSLHKLQLYIHVKLLHTIIVSILCQL